MIPILKNDPEKDLEAALAELPDLTNEEREQFFLWAESQPPQELSTATLRVLIEAIRIHRRTTSGPPQRRRQATAKTLTLDDFAKDL